MMHYTHLAFGLLIALLSLDLFGIENKLLFVLTALFFSVLPDIDKPKSKIGRKNKVISRIINFVFGHRGLLHTIYIPVALFFIFYNLNKEMGIAILVGYFSHLIIDALTKAGIRPFYPIFNRKVNGFFRTNSFFEKTIFLIVLLADFYIILKYI
ncbi:metal-dependent hydrolase [Candidatus Woesearchaeota archaeon]|nr:metal-dependent hydrolase [Candidatus Woesearchaeota archaeon]